MDDWKREPFLVCFRGQKAWSQEGKQDWKCNFSVDDFVFFRSPKNLRHLQRPIVSYRWHETILYKRLTPIFLLVFRPFSHVLSDLSSFKPLWTLNTQVKTYLLVSLRGLLFLRAASLRPDWLIGQWPKNWSAKDWLIWNSLRLSQRTRLLGLFSLSACVRLM